MVYTYLKLLYGYSKLLYYYSLYSVYGDNIFDDLTYVENVRSSIEKSGCMVIKSVQWFLPKISVIYNLNNNLVTELNKLYDNCGVHNIEHTEYIYKSLFNKDFKDKYKILEILGSGSIGQVYKIEDIHTNHIYALKVNHPNLDNEYKLFSLFIKSIYKIRQLLYYVPIKDINPLLEELQLQLDLRNECNNNSLNKELYGNRDIIIIPNIYYASKNLLLMEYIEGDKLSKDIGDYTYNKMVLCLIIFIISSAVYNLPIHGDLHCGNYKIVKDNDMYKLIIYDFGYCFNIDFDDFLIIEDAINNPKDKENVNKLISLVLNHKDNNTNAIFNLDNNEIHTRLSKTTTVSNTINIIVDYFKENAIYLPEYIVNILLLILHIDTLIQSGTQIYDHSEKHNFNLLIRDILNAYNICPLYKTYLSDYTPKEYINNLKLNFDILKKDI